MLSQSEPGSVTRARSPPWRVTQTLPSPKGSPLDPMYPERPITRPSREIVSSTVTDEDVAGHRDDRIAGADDNCVSVAGGRGHRRHQFTGPKVKIAG